MAGFEPTTLRTSRLTLRPPDKGDAADVFAAVDLEIQRWLSWSVGYTYDAALRWCTADAHHDPDHELTLAIVPDTTRRFAGAVGVMRADWSSGVAEIGYWLGPADRRHGYVAEAVRAMARHAFGLGLCRLELLAAVANVASQRVAQHVGFTREGVLRKARPIPGGRADMVLFSLLEGEL